MIWESVGLGLVILGLGFSVYMASRSKPNNITFNGLDLTHLIDQLAKAIGKEVADQLAAKGMGRVSFDKGAWINSVRAEADEAISMDDSIIPMKVDTSKLEANLDNMAKQEVAVDNDVKKNKSKLADLMKKKKKE